MSKNNLFFNTNSFKADSIKKIFIYQHTYLYEKSYIHILSSFVLGIVFRSNLFFIEAVKSEFLIRTLIFEVRVL